MSHVQTFSFDKEGFALIKEYHHGRNWPVVYISENGKEAYIGETINVYSRSKQHYENPARRRLTKIHLVTDEEFNKSATLDIESWLIQHMAADGKFKLQNGNSGLKDHNYYDRDKYKAKFELFWEELRKLDLTINSLSDLKNSDLFKYSPYKSLTEDQFIVSNQIVADLEKNIANAYIVNGKPGTGKTILATYLFKFLKEKKETKDLSIALVIPMTSLRKTIKKVFKNIQGLSSSMVIGPNDVVKKKYDLLIVDEAHRLSRRRNIVNYASFDKTNKSLGLGNEGNELDWIMQSSVHQIFFYDSNQSVKPSDIRSEDFKNISMKSYELTTQMRVDAGVDFIECIEDIFEMRIPKKTSFSNYDFKLYNDIHKMVADIKEKDKTHGLSRVVAGYAWPWHTRKDAQDFDIEIDGLKMVWNSTAQDWVNSPNAINEVGCIHTVQGYDLNYVGVIIGPEFTYNKQSKKFVVDKEKYLDVNGHRGVTDPLELERYIINIYKTLLTRGIKGTYVYVVDDCLREYLKEVFRL